MKIKKFDYKKKNISSLRKDTTIRFSFLLGFLVIFAWQTCLLIVNYNAKNMDVAMYVIAISVMITSILFCLILFSFCFKNLDIVMLIKRKTHTIVNVTLFSDGKKNSFLRLFYLLSNLFGIIMLVFLVCGLTYSLLQFVYYSIVSYYLPFLMLLALCGFYSVYHLNHELQTIKEVDEYNSIY